MLKRIVLFAFALVALEAHAARAVIQIDLNANALRLETFEGNKYRKLDIATLPAIKDSFHAGTFTPSEKIYRTFRSVNGNVYLDNVIYFNGSRSIRTASVAALKRGDRTAGSIGIDPDTGSLIADTIKRVGAKNTQIIIIIKEAKK